MARRHLAKLRPFDPANVEQPLEMDDLAGDAALRRAQSVPIAIDEGAYSLDDVGNVIQAEAADYLLLVPHQAGGLWQAIKSLAICVSNRRLPPPFVGSLPKGGTVRLIFPRFGGSEDLDGFVS